MVETAALDLPSPFLRALDFLTIPGTSVAQHPYVFTVPKLAFTSLSASVLSNRSPPLVTASMYRLLYSFWTARCSYGEELHANTSDR
jgi:hypothetical protein